jgi:hypothetical protein
MKKILIILLFSLFASSNLFAESFKLNQFNKWLSENGYHQYLTEQGSNNLNIKIKEQSIISHQYCLSFKPKQRHADLLFMEILI